MTTKDTDYGKEQARAKLDSIVGMVAAVNKGEEWEEQDAGDAIQESPLCVEVRSVWHTPGSSDVFDNDYKVLLCTGGPAVQIRGTLGRFNVPDSAWLEYQDWGTPWTRYNGTTSDEDDALVEYARQFYYGDS